MGINKNNFFSCPISKEPLFAKGDNFTSESGTDYFKKGLGFYDFKIKSHISSSDEYYKNISSTYDTYNDLTFKIQGQDEKKIRKFGISKLGKLKNKELLEIGCGTGRDSELIIEKLKNSQGNYFLLDSSKEMLEICINKLKEFKFKKKHFVLAEATNLPFQDNKFDLIYQFTVYPSILNKEMFFNEINRILKPGGKFVMISEGISENIKDTTFAKIILNNSQLYNEELPIKYLPKEATNIKIEYLLNEIFFYFSFKKRKIERALNDIIIPGKRGGTLKTRYYGKTEGLTLETKKLALEAQKHHNISMHDWLDNIIKKQSLKVINEKK